MGLYDAIEDHRPFFMRITGHIPYDLVQCIEKNDKTVYKIPYTETINLHFPGLVIVRN